MFNLYLAVGKRPGLTACLDHMERLSTEPVLFHVSQIMSIAEGEQIAF